VLVVPSFDLLCVIVDFTMQVPQSLKIKNCCWQLRIRYWVNCEEAKRKDWTQATKLRCSRNCKNCADRTKNSKRKGECCTDKQASCIALRWRVSTDGCAFTFSAGRKIACLACTDVNELICIGKWVVIYVLWAWAMVQAVRRLCLWRQRRSCGICGNFCAK